MKKTVEYDNLSSFITRIRVIPTMSDVKIKIEADQIRLTCFDNQNKFLISWQEDTNKEKNEEVKAILENNKINFSDGELFEKNTE